MDTIIQQNADLCEDILLHLSPLNDLYLTRDLKLSTKFGQRIGKRLYHLLYSPNYKDNERSSTEVTLPR